MSFDRIIADGIKVGAQVVAAKFASDAQSYRCRGSSSFPRTRPFPGDTISVGARQRHSSRVCVARGRARTLRSIAASPRNHKSAVEHTRRSAPEASFGSSRHPPYALGAILKQALSMSLYRGEPAFIATTKKPPFLTLRDHAVLFLIAMHALPLN